MICQGCKIDKVESYFINGNKTCYHCIYQRKIKIKNKNYCRKCGKELISDTECKKRQRTIFCSEECAQKGHVDQLNNHWTKKIG